MSFSKIVQELMSWDPIGPGSTPLNAQEFYLPGEAPRLVMYTAAYEVTPLEPRIARYERLVELRRADPTWADLGLAESQVA
jgi:hypothetical protein